VKQSPTDFYNTIDPARWGRSEMPDALNVTSEWLAGIGIDTDDFVVELGCGRGAIGGVSHCYVGIDLSLPASGGDAAERYCPSTTRERQRRAGRTRRVPRDDQACWRIHATVETRPADHGAGSKPRARSRVVSARQWIGLPSAALPVNSGSTSMSRRR